MLLAALALLALDALVVFLLAGGIGQILRKRPQRAAAALVLAGAIAALTFGSQALAQQQRPPAQLHAPPRHRRKRCAGRPIAPPISTSP